MVRMIQDYNFGIEIEMTGQTRAKAAEVVAGYFGTVPEHIGGAYDKYGIRDTQGRLWQACQRFQHPNLSKSPRKYPAGE